MKTESWKLKTFENSRNKISLDSHSENRRFDCRPKPYAFDNNIRKSDIQMIHHWLILYSLLVLEMLIIL